MPITDNTAAVVQTTVRAYREAAENRYDRLYYSGGYVLNPENMVYRDPTTLDIHDLSQVNATNYPALGTQYDLQRFAAMYFAGMAGSGKRALDAADLNFPVAARGVFKMNCAAASQFNFGQMVAAAVNGGNTACLADTIVATNDPNLAVGIVCEEASTVQYPSGTALVQCLMGTNLDTLFSGLNGGGVKLGKLTETINFGSITGASTTGTYTFTQKLPAGALVLGVRYQVVAALAGTGPVTAATMTAGWTGHTAAFSADATPNAFAVGYYASAPTAAGPMPNSEVSPLVTFALTGGNAVNLTAGQVIADILYAPPHFA